MKSFLQVSYRFLHLLRLLQRIECQNEKGSDQLNQHYQRKSIDYRTDLLN